jgi:glycosyltransferase involved in cell wall biosynthesis
MAASVPLLVFADDWGRHPSSTQHLVRWLLDRHEVYWVNTIGTRAPRLDAVTFRRGLEKLRAWTALRTTRAECHPRLHVLNPRMWPWFRSRFDRRLNRYLLARQLDAVVKALPEPPVVVTMLPIVADLVGVVPAQRWVYYCVDDFGAWPGLDQVPLRQMEDDLIRRADVRIAVSEPLRERLVQRAGPTHLLTHGVDLEFWASGGDRHEPIPALRGLERPLIVFWGLTDRRMDVALVRRLASDLPAGTIALVGRQLDPDPELLAIPRVVHVGMLPYPLLPAVAQAASVLIMPYADLPVTRAMQPVKLKEYLATGKPAVVRDLPSVRPWADCLDTAASPEAFSEAVRKRLVEGLPPAQQRARQRLVAEGWIEKARQFERWILEPEEAMHPTNGQRRVTAGKV